MESHGWEILFLILICLTVLDLWCSGSSREVYFHEAYRVVSPGLPACCCPEQIISGLCLHLTHTLKTDVNNGHRLGGRQGTKSPPVCFHPNRLGWRGQQCAEKMVRLRWKDKLSQSPVKMCPQDKGVIITLDLPLFFKEVCISLFLAVLGLHGCMRAFSSFSEPRLLSSWGVWASHCGGFSCCRMLERLELRHGTSVAVAPRL